MKRKILIEKKEKKIWTFLLENDSITEIHCTPENDEKARYQIGDIYIGKVQNIVANIGAAFIEIARESTVILTCRECLQLFLRIRSAKSLSVSEMTSCPDQQGGG